MNVTFQTTEQHTLVGDIEYPKGKGACPGVILVHGFVADKDLHFFPQLQQKLAEAGFAALRFDLTSCGESEGTIHPTYKTILNDIGAALNFLAQQPRIEGIALAGHSMGGTGCLLACGLHPGIGAVVTYGAPARPSNTISERKKLFARKNDGTYTFTNVLGKTYTFTENYFLDAEEVHPLVVVRNLATPKLFIHATQDNQVFFDDAEDYFLRSRIPKSFKKIEGSNHFFKGAYEEIITSTIEFFKEWMHKEK